MRHTVPFTRSAPAAIVEPSVETPIYADVDVVVVGGGPAGVGAALSAARAGAQTLLVERYGCLGGIWTAGLLNPYFDGARKGGIPTEIIDRLRHHGAADAVQEWLPEVFVADVFDYEVMKYVLDRMAEEAGVRVLLYSMGVAAIVDDGRMQGIIVENKSGRSAILAEVVIDCTGDGDIAFHAGCDYEKGRPSDGLLQPMTLQFTVQGFQWTPRPYEVMAKHNSPDDLASIPFTDFAVVPVPGRGGLDAIMWTHMQRRDGTDADDLTAAVIEGRRQAHLAMRMFDNTPEFGEGHLISTAMQVGVRETRRIRGEYRLDFDDLVNGRTFDDGICTATFPMDIHAPDDTKLTATPVKPYQIPLRCLVPTGVDQLLVAGRCISGSHEAHGSYRVTGNCVAMGEAAGLAAAEACRTGVDVRQLDGAKIKQLLRTRGVNV